jgi:hypothetical protein
VHRLNIDPAICEDATILSDVYRTAQHLRMVWAHDFFMRAWLYQIGINKVLLRIRGCSLNSIRSNANKYWTFGGTFNLVEFKGCGWRLGQLSYIYGCVGG